MSAPCSFSRAVGPAVGLVIVLGLCAPVALAQTDSPTIELTVAAGRPIRVALDQSVRLTQVGELITATVEQTVYAYDRIVLPAGTVVHGHVAQLIGPTKSARVRALLGGNFSPPRRVVLDFDSVLVNGAFVPLESVVTASAGRVRQTTAKDDGATSGVAAAVKQRERDALATLKEPGKMSRLKQMLVSRLPVHPQYLQEGTVYTLQLKAPLRFGPVTPTPVAPPGTQPAPDSVLSARLVTPLSSEKSERGTAVVAVLSEPVFSATHELVLPEGAVLEGEVTFARPARRWHRNGQLRFLFEQTRPAPTQDASPMLASLYSVEASQDARVAIDEEGGASATSSKTRFIAPAIAVAALRGSTEEHTRRFDNDGDPYDLGQVPATVPGNPAGRALGGFFGFGLIGVAFSQVSRPVGIAFAAVGAAKAVTTNIFGRGTNVSFDAGTPIQVRLAPGKTPDK